MRADGTHRDVELNSRANIVPGMHLTVVPGTGTGELAGITGNAAIRVADGVHAFELEYDLGA